LHSLLTLAQVYRTRKDYNSALKNAHEAYNLASKQKLPIVIGQASSILSDLYSITGRSDLAYGYLKEFFLINDSINNNEYHKQVTRLEIEYEYDQRQKAAEYARMQERIVNENRLKQQGLYLRGLVILLVLLAIISILFIRHNRVRSKYDRIDLEQRLLRAQMNPHFIFNSLCAVQDFILSGKSQMANAFLTKIASLMRNILEQTGEEYIPLEKEIETLRLYLEVQKLRFEKEFEYTLIMDKEIDPQNLSVPPMLAQPCVENSIEHGLLKSKHSGLLQISYHLVNGLLMLEVTDNGVGRKRASEISGSRMKRNSISTKLTQKRLMHFRKVLKEKSISYEIIDLYEGDDPAGTKVIMKLPYKKIYA